MLTTAETDRFVADGFLPLRRAVPSDVAAACADRIWVELGKQGIRRQERATWSRPVVWLPCPEGGPFVDAGTSPGCGRPTTS